MASSECVPMYCYLTGSVTTPSIVEELETAMYLLRHLRILLHQFTYSAISGSKIRLQAWFSYVHTCNLSFPCPLFPWPLCITSFELHRAQSASSLWLITMDAPAARALLGFTPLPDQLEALNKHFFPDGCVHRIQIVKSKPETRSLIYKTWDLQYI